MAAPPETDWFADWADRYDAGLGAMGEAAAIEPAVDLLAELAGDGAALELAIGTGRIALPLAARGVPVHGIDLSPAMVEQLRAKPGGAAIPVELGDMTATRVDGPFRLVYLVYNTINNLTTQDAQVACFENAARHLEPGGSFVIEVGVPDLQRLPPGEHYVAFAVRDDYVGVDEYDPVNQGLISHHQSTGRRLSMPFRYVWPAELDLMARIAGMQLRDRWQDWERTPFTAASRKHVSVWQKR
ncbi:MAG TPA: class I SAM-dependent methyltransferase [Gaiellaceae bacterium]